MLTAYSIGRQGIILAMTRLLKNSMVYWVTHRVLQVCPAHQEGSRVDVCAALYGSMHETWKDRGARKRNEHEAKYGMPGTTILTV